MPPDALFCHKCGKPQRELLTPEPAVQEERPRFPQPREVLREALPLNFHNATAVRIALIVAVSSTLVGLVIPVVNWVFGGFLAVFFYRRRTGSLLDVGAGMRMGWITGVLAFVLYLIPFSFVMANLSTVMHERLSSMPGQDPATVERMIQLAQSGSGIAMLLVFLFVVITFFSIAGGALGAKVVGRQ